MTVPRRTFAALLLLMVLAIGVAPALAPAVRAEDPTPTPVETPTPTPTPIETPSASPSPSPTPTVPPIGSPKSPMSDHLSSDVYGYLPYWEMTSAIVDYLDWNALSVLSLFSVTQTATGTINRSLAGCKAIIGSLGRTLVATAKARGVRVELTFTSFGYDKNAAFFGDPARQETLIAELRALVLDVGADGVNVDVELIKGTWFAAYGAFVANLRAALQVDNPAASVSVATNANTSGAQMAKRAADAGADRIFIMGYAYRTTSSNPGAIAPLVGRSSPSGLDLRWTVDRYALEGVPLGRTILGLPYYGVSWPTASGALGAPRTTTGSTYVPRRHIGEPRSLGASLRYEPGESVSWYAWYDTAAGTWRQVFYDTPASLRPKYAYAVARGLAGVGIWALGYDRGVPGYWELLKSMFGPPLVATLSVAPSLTRSLTVAATVGSAPGSRPVTDVRFHAEGQAWGPWQPIVPATVDVTTGLPAPAPPYPVTLKSSVADGRRLVWAQVRDQGGTLSSAVSAAVTLDRTAPVLAEAPVLWYSTTSGSWRARWKAAKDPHAPVGYRVQYSVNNGPWKIATLQTPTAGIVLPVRSRAAKVAVRVRAVDVLGNWGPAKVTRR